MIQQLKQEYEKREQEIKSRLEDFKKVKKEDYFYEACFCILTPQSKAKNCWSTVLALKTRDFKNKAFDPVKFIDGVRFHNNKSKYLLELKNKFDLVIKNIGEIKDSRELREWLVSNIKGYSLKEASHFLRNTGHRDLAIIDRHILKNLHKFGVIDEIPKTVTRNKYFEIEEKFKEFSNKVGIDMDELDLLFWSMQTGEVFK